MSSSITSKLRPKPHRRRGKRGVKKTGIMSLSLSKVWNASSEALPCMNMRYPDNAVFKFFSMFETPSFLTSSNTGNTYTSFTINANSHISQYTSFSAVFDQYRITVAEVWLYPVNPQSPTGAAVNRGQLLTVIDYDDAGSLASSAAALEYENCVVTPASCGQYRKFSPHIAVAAYSGAFTSYSNQPANTWIDTASNTVNYYGMKIVAEAADAAADVTVYNLLMRLHFEMRNVR
jgi:hypothetical protein